MKIIIYIMLFCIMPVFVMSFIEEKITDTEFSYKINTSELPFNYSRIFILSGYDGLMLNVSYGNFTSGINNVLFTSSTYDLRVNISIKDNILVKNYTDIVLLNNYENNITLNITFNFFIINDSLPPDVDFTQIDVNEFEYVVCDYVLPYNTTRQIVVNARAGQTVYTDYDSNFFVMPDSFIVPPVNYSLVDVLITLNNLSIGKYDKNIGFSVVSNTSEVLFHFDIKDCVIPITVCDNLFEELHNACDKVNKTSSEILECKRLEVEYDKCIYDALLDASEDTISNNTIIEYVNSTNLVPAISLEKATEFLSALDSFVLTWKQLQTEQSQNKKTISDLENEIADLRNLEFEDKIAKEQEISTRVKQVVNELAIQNNLKSNMINEYEKNYIKKSILLTIFYLIVIIATILFGFKIYNENIWW